MRYTRMGPFSPRLGPFVNQARRTYRPYRCNQSYWKDRRYRRRRFYVYVNRRRDGSLYVGHTGRPVRQRLRQHRCRDTIKHKRTVISVRARDRGHAMGLEATLCQILRRAGLPATKRYGPVR